MQELLDITMLLGYLQGVIPQIIDHRQPSPNKKYSIRDAVMSGFSIFFFQLGSFSWSGNPTETTPQCESFLEYQKQLNSRKGRDNTQTLFGVIKIPTDAQIRNILDPINPNILFDVFIKIYHLLKSQGVLKQYEVLGGQLLIPLDGTEYFSSQCINCDNCSHRKHKNGSVTYFHSAILPVIVSPKLEHVISLDPEFITPQDGHTKQDCETFAAKRWIQRHAEIFERGAMTLLGDDLFSRQPMCEVAIQSGFHYIFVCLPQSHLTLYEWLDYLGGIGEIKSYQERHRHGRDWHLYQYRWTNRIPLRDAQPALETNWFELIITRQSDGHPLFHNSWITDHLVCVDNIVELSQAGRARWKTENENHNTLKTQGYHLEHNFGHGSQFLASFLLTLNLLAFLFHTVLHLVDVKYQQVRQQIGTRKRFFQDLRALTTYFVFDHWLHLFSFMLDEFEPLETANSS